MTQDEILKALEQRFPGKDNNGEPKNLFFKRALGLPRDKLLKLTQERIWLSAYANNNPHSDYHWQADSLYQIFYHRQDTDGYTIAYRKAFIEATGQDLYPEKGPLPD